MCAVATAPPLWQRLLRRPASESGCGNGSSGGQRPSLGDYVTATTRGAGGAGGC
jgi:hypothetical protein